MRQNEPAFIRLEAGAYKWELCINAAMASGTPLGNEICPLAYPRRSRLVENTGMAA